MKKIIYGISGSLALFVGAGTVISCGAGTSEIGATVYNATDPFMTLVTEAMQKTVDDLNSSMNLQDSAGDQAKQNDQIDSMISSGVEGLAINLVDPAAGQGVIDKAKDADIPIVLYNKEVSSDATTAESIMGSYDQVYYVGTRSAESGEMQAELIYDDLVNGIIKDRNGDGKIGYYVLSGEAGHADAIARTDAVRDHLYELIAANGVNPLDGQSESEEIKVDSNGNIHILSGLEEATIESLFNDLTPTSGDWTDWSQQKGKDTGQSVIDANGDELDIFICNNDALAVGVSKAAEEDKDLVAYTEGYEDTTNLNHLPIYGIDATDDALKTIQDGWMSGTVLNDAETQGSLTILILKNLIAGVDPLYNIDGYEIEEGTKAIRVPYVPVSREDDLVKNA